MSDWTVYPAEKKAVHASGLMLVFEGVPETDNFNGAPRNYSKTMNPLELSRLIREGFAAYQAAFKPLTGSTGINQTSTQHV